MLLTKRSHSAETLTNEFVNITNKVIKCLDKVGSLIDSGKILESTEVVEQIKNYSSDIASLKTNPEIDSILEKEELLSLVEKQQDKMHQAYLDIEFKLNVQFEISRKIAEVTRMRLMSSRLDDIGYNESGTIGPVDDPIDPVSYKKAL